MCKGLQVAIRNSQMEEEKRVRFDEYTYTLGRDASIVKSEGAPNKKSSFGRR
jgi:hypothetical protein